MDIETRLRHDLADRAGDISAAPTDLYEQVLDGRRTQRRHRMGLVALAAALVAIVALVPLTIGNDGRGQTATPSGTPSTAPAAPDGPVVPYQRYGLPPRGSLAGDAGYLQGLLDRPWSRLDPSTDPARETRQVVFAGEVPGGVQALVVGEQDGGLVGLWLNGPVGAGPGQLEASNEAGPVDPSLPLTFTHIQDGVGALIVLGRPGDVIEVSTGREVGVDGSLTQLPYRLVGDSTGLAVVDVTGLSQLATAVRVTRDGQVVDLFSQGGGGGGTYEEPDLTGALAGAAGDPDQGIVRAALDVVLPQLGLTIDQVQVQVLWGGAIGNSAEPDAVAAALTVRTPSGAVLLLGWMGWDRASEQEGGGLGATGPCAIALLPAGTDVSVTGVAMSCDLYSTRDGSDLGHQLVVVPPAGTTDLQAIGAGGEVLQAYGLNGSAVVVPAPDGVARVTALDAAGQVLGEIPLTGRQELTAD
jgi:hypothetical protein